MKWLHQGGSYALKWLHLEGELRLAVGLCSPGLVAYHGGFNRGDAGWGSSVNSRGKLADIEIYLDMDGVCVDFIGAALRAQGYDPAEVLPRWRAEHPGSLFPEPLLEVSAKEFFTHEQLQGKSFWQRLEPYPWFETLYEELGKRGHVVFLTAPTNAPGCVSGKQEWLIEQFGHGFTDFIFTRHKDRLAHGSAFLVDDMPFNVESFAKRDGHGLLFPQIWNENHHVEDPLCHLLEALDARLGS